jgi:branched-subunit amino acid transport protein
MTWIAVLAVGVGCYVLKLIGLSVPASVFERPLVRRIGTLLPVALLAALIAVGTFSTGTDLTVDARAAGLAAAVIALLLRAPFLLVVIVAAATSALIRLV